MQATRQLVEQDKVFAIFNSIGTEHNLAVRDYLNANKVPQLFAASGATTFGRDAREVPVTIGFQPSYQAEGWVLRQVPGAHAGPGARSPYSSRTTTTARICWRAEAGYPALEGQGRRGRALRRDGRGRAGAGREAQGVRSGHVRRLRRGEVRDPGIRLRATASAGSPSSSINNIVSSASNVMTIAGEGGTNKLVDATISVVFLKDPTDPKWQSDAGDQALSADSQAPRPGRQRGRSVPRLRDGGRLHARRGAEEGGRNPRARDSSRPSGR